MEKIAILGGGVAALTAAFELTERDPRQERFDITVYQVGWRLGGKGAVGRNQENHDRVEEHGLHVWTGFYDNAFQLVDRVYAALQQMGQPVPFGGRDQAFQALASATLMQQQGNQWVPWTFDLPRRDGTPGVFDPAFEPTLVDYLRSLLDFTRQRAPDAVVTDDFDRSLDEASACASAMPQDPASVTAEMRNQLNGLIEKAHSALPRLPIGLEGFAALPAPWPPEAERDAVLAEVALVLAKGLLAEEVLSGGLDALDDIEWSAWMRKNGCSDAALQSAIVRGCYDYVFGFVGGQGDVAAGTGTRILLKLVFGYKDAFFFVMRATMGELLFAPLYLVLRERGVKFAFFHRVDELVLSADKKLVDAIQVTVQATPVGEYDPLVSVTDAVAGPLASWPSHPEYGELVEGDAIREGGFDLESPWTAWGNVDSTSLRRGTDFDRVVLGIGLGAFPWICQDLMAAHPQWQQMVDNVKTTPTMALQVWTTCPTRELVDPAADPDIRSAFAKPLDSWGDLSLMLSQEDWPQPAPQGLHYFVGSFEPDAPLPPPGPGNEHFPRQQLDRARQLQRQWFVQDLPKLWPGLLQGGQIRWDLLAAPAGASEQERLDAQYARVNINPSDHYVQSVTGSSKFRLAAGGSGVANLYLAGDWVRTEINAGCVEAAVMAGRDAANAITGMEVAMPNTNQFGDSGFANVALPLLSLLRKIEHRTSGGTGTMDGYCIIASLDTDTVASCLPPGVTLSNPKLDAQRVVFVFAHQRNVRPGLLPFGGLRYTEVMQIVPDVRLEQAAFGRQVRFSFMPNLLVDQLVPVLVGQNAYGFNKHLARIRSGDGSFDVRSAFGATSAQFTLQGLPGGIDGFPEIEAMQEALQLPLLGLAPDGSFVMSKAHFELDAATFQRVGGAARIGRPFLQDGIQLSLEADPKAQAWGFRMQCRWRLSLPAGDLGGPRRPDYSTKALVDQCRERLLGQPPTGR